MFSFFLEPPEIRLTSGPNHCSGRVEIFHEKLWGTLCDDDWDLDDARVVCRYLGCGTALSAPRGSRFGQGSGPIWLDGINCTGSETAISKCPAKPWGSHDCTHSEDAGVICAGGVSLCKLRTERSSVGRGVSLTLLLDRYNCMVWVRIIDGHEAL